MKRSAALLFSMFVIVVATITIAYQSCIPVKCKEVCNNGGTCHDNACTCPPAFYGPHCDSLNIYGTWAGADTISADTIYQQTVTVSRSISGADSIVTISLTSGPAEHTSFSGVLSTNKNVASFNKQLVVTGWGADTIDGNIVMGANSKLYSYYRYYNSQWSVWYSVRGQYSK